MEPSCFNGTSCPITAHPQIFTVILILVLIDLILKGFALWRAARLKHTAWFIAILIINSVGVLPLIYLLMVRKEKIKSEEKVDQ